jgi:hypothetical protein
LLNGNVDHVCDFKFIFPDFNSILAQVGLVNPVTAIRDAIKNAKLKATNTLRKIIQEAVTAIRTALNATIAVLGFDASGVFSFNISALKAIAAEVEPVGLGEVVILNFKCAFTRYEVFVAAYRLLPNAVYD